MATPIKPLHEMNFMERVAYDDVFVLDRLSNGHMLDGDEANDALEAAIIALKSDPLSLARLAVRLLTVATAKNPRIGRIAVHAAKARVASGLDGYGSTTRRHGRHGRDPWIKSPRGPRHAK